MHFIRARGDSIPPWFEFLTNSMQRMVAAARWVGIGIILAFMAPFCHAQVPANLLPVVGPEGDYVRSPGEEVKLVSVTQSGMVLECTQNTPPGQSFTWRERYSVRDGRLILDAVLTPHMVPPQAAHMEWQVSSKIGTSNIGPTTVDPRWKDYRAYLQRVIETAQSEWEWGLAEWKIDPKIGKSVSVKFIMDSKGGIPRITDVHPSPGTPDEATRACVWAITAQAPYGQWTEDMVAAMGTEQEMTFSFYYQ